MFPVVSRRLMLVAILAGALNGCSDTLSPPNRTDTQEHLHVVTRRDENGNFDILLEDKPIGIVVVDSNWIFISNLKASDKQYVVRNQGMAPVSLSLPGLRELTVRLDSINDYGCKNQNGCLSFYMTYGNRLRQSVLTQQTKLLISQNSSGQLIYSFDIMIETVGDENVLSNIESLEYQDILFDGVVSGFYPAKRMSWSWLFFTKGPRTLRRPLNHHNAHNEQPIRTDKGFMFGIGENVDNPMITFDRNTAAASFAILCTWAFDLRLFLDLKQAKSVASNKTRYKIEYQIELLRQSKAQETYRNSLLDSEVQRSFATPHFALDGKNTFEPDQKFSLPNDHYFWYCFADRAFCTWDRTFGNRSKGSLKIRNTFWRNTEWRFTNLSPSHMDTLVPLSGRYRISMDIFAPEALGTFTLGFTSFFSEEKTVEVQSIQSWRTVIIEISGISGVYAYLSEIRAGFRGIGELWIDNIMIEKAAENH